MSRALRSLWVVPLIVGLLVGCSAVKGKTMGESIDDSTITTEVKAKLAAEKVATLTKISVNTNRGSVYLTGNVENESMRLRAADIARQVAGVREVVNNLKIQAQ
ncbi:MAG TPA: BON domain-containing protein [Methylomirabilota bacterium]|jgi:hyperosmotically inducible protein|nr:BON domain-containing protein [Methylomirabilota bacterium]